MTTVDPSTLRSDRNNFFRDLADNITGEVSFSAMARGLFATDGSNYRVVPLGVVFPKTYEEVVTTIAIARSYDVALIQRGGGTSTGGQAVGPGLVVDYSRHLDRILELDVENHRARVESGTVLDVLQRHAAPHHLRFGPDPSTHDRCTIGGMIGNNACGAHSLQWGKTDDNVLALQVATYGGDQLELSTLDALSRDSSRAAGDLSKMLATFLARHHGAIRDEMGVPMSRRVSGYGLQHLLPENGGHLARALVGTEGTCVAIIDATVQLVEPARANSLLILGFSSIYEAADFVPVLLGRGAATIEGLDARLVDLARHTNESGAGAALLPNGGGWLLLEVGGDSPLDAHDRAHDLVTSLGRGDETPSAAIIDDPFAQRAVWRLREDGAGLATRLPDGTEAWPGWEDAAVPPEYLGAYLRQFDRLLVDHGRRGMHYGHYGEGCVHIRIDFDFLSPEGLLDFRRFIEEAADLVVSFGGSLSGEHGDGQARGELLYKMYPPSVLEAFRAFKAIFDPTNHMNPGHVVEPRLLDADLRVAQPVRFANRSLNLALSADNGDLGAAVRRCVGVGKCRRLEGGSMCPSFQVTRNEQDSTRGRARLLTEMFSGELITDGWRSKEVAESLDLCLSCKACRSECPVGVDMAAYKAEFLSHHYRGRLRPRVHYALGYLPMFIRWCTPVASFANRMTRSRLAPFLKRIVGIDVKRSIPSIASLPLQARHREQTVEPSVILWPDTFTNYFSPQVGEAAIDVLEALGERVLVPGGVICCGLTWYSTGQLTKAKSVLANSLRSLSAVASGELPVVVLEPSCASMLREEATELLKDDADVADLASRIVSFGEYVQSLLGQRMDHPFEKSAHRFLAQVHCHQHATSGYKSEGTLLRELGDMSVQLETSCCGLAGNFGFEDGHFEISRAVGEHGILGKIARNDAAVEVVADGFSCRTQIAELTEVSPKHLAEILRDALKR